MNEYQGRDIFHMFEILTKNFSRKAAAYSDCILHPPPRAFLSCAGLALLPI